MAIKSYSLHAFLVPFQKSDAINYLAILSFLLSVCLLVGCDRHKNLTKEKLDEIRAKIALDDARREARQSSPPMDPLLCKDNPEGYIYFKIGEELFRYVKGSPIYIHSVKSDSLRSDLNARGCKDSPYPVEDIGLIYEGIEVEGNRLQLASFWLQGVLKSKQKTPSFKQGFQEGQFFSFKNSGTNCSFVSNDTEVCIWQSENSKIPQEEWSRVFRINVQDSFQRDLIFNCIGGALLECETTYRLYPSVDISYSYYPEKNRVDESQIIYFDKKLRETFENMRVSSH